MKITQISKVIPKGQQQKNIKYKLRMENRDILDPFQKAPYGAERSVARQSLVIDTF